VVKSDDIPAATQLFTPNWIVKYLVQNSVCRQWLQTYPDSSLKAGMEYYIEPAKQTESVGVALAANTPDSINPKALKILDPACGHRISAPISRLVEYRAIAFVRRFFVLSIRLHSPSFLIA
jgi:type II restriction/modification system DNA methylase subunit YeeA